MNTLRLAILTAAYRAQAGHVPSSLSILDLVYGIYHGVLQDGDRFILSKGHGALALYAVLGLLPDFAAGTLAGHPERGDGIELTSGSLGHGLGVAAGIALGNKIAGHPGRVFVLVGDGECQEGSVWEAARVIGKLRLNVICILDYNGSHPDTALPLLFGDFGWKKCQIDGHNAGHVQTLGEMHGPQLVLARTVKGRGVPEMEADPQAWHHRAPNKDEFDRMAARL